jgi:Na+/melibiose symporter-like transporter
MLQIIGWFLCVYLVIKACELLSMQTDEHRFARVTATIGAIIALIAAAGFFYLINEQVKESRRAQDQVNAATNAAMKLLKNF